MRNSSELVTQEINEDVRSSLEIIEKQIPMADVLVALFLEFGDKEVMELVSKNFESELVTSVVGQPNVVLTLSGRVPMEGKFRCHANLRFWFGRIQNVLEGGSRSLNIVQSIEVTAGVREAGTWSSSRGHTLRPSLRLNMIDTLNLPDPWTGWVIGTLLPRLGEVSKEYPDFSDAPVAWEGDLGNRGGV